MDKKKVLFIAEIVCIILFLIYGALAIFKTQETIPDAQQAMNYILIALIIKLKLQIMEIKDVKG